MKPAWQTQPPPSQLPPFQQSQGGGQTVGLVKGAAELDVQKELVREEAAGLVDAGAGLDEGEDEGEDEGRVRGVPGVPEEGEGRVESET